MSDDSLLYPFLTASLSNDEKFICSVRRRASNGVTDSREFPKARESGSTPVPVFCVFFSGTLRGFTNVVKRVEEGEPGKRG